MGSPHPDGHRLLLAGVGILLTNANVSPHVGIGQIGWTMFIAGVGVGMAMVPVTSASLGSVPAKHSGMAASATNTFQSSVLSWGWPSWAPSSTVS